LGELRDLIAEGAVSPVQADVDTSEAVLDPRTPVQADAQEDGALPSMGIPPAEGTEAERRDAESAALLESLGGVLTPEEEALLAGLGGGRTDPLSVYSQNPFLRFGERIYLRADGRIMKVFPLAAGRGRRIVDILKIAGGFPLRYSEPVAQAGTAVRNEEPLPEGWAEVVLLEDWDSEFYQDFSLPTQGAPKDAVELALADWLIVTADEDLLADIEAFINLFAASVPQVEIEASVVEITTTDELDYGVTGPNGAAIFDFPAGTFVDSLLYDLPNTVQGNEALLSIGAIQDGVVFEAVLEAVQTWENVKITAQPRIAVREGGVADIQSTQDIPFFNFTGINAAGNFTASINFKQVGVKLYIAPRVVGTETLALNLFIEASQQVGTSVSFSTSEGDEFAAPIIASRMARTVVYLQPGQALILGGLESERTVERERKIPILGDIPILGLLFRSDLTRKERTNVLFFIRPRILRGADFNRQF
ncbi:MAG TPA: hypothetical protein VJP77_00770, partial [Planctomycetota bacterium]|nr:hypothetical protein [Planctomycetota bacterium]